MEKRIGIIAIFIKNSSQVQDVNTLLSEYAGIIIARQGLPFKERSLAVISLIMEGSMNELNALSGKLGKLSGIETKIMLQKSINIL